MPDLHMSFFTPSDLLRLEQDTSRYAQMVKRSMVGSKGNESWLDIDFEPAAKNAYVVKGAHWHFAHSDASRDVHRCFQEPSGSDIIEVPSNMAHREYFELLFLKVSNGLGGTLVLDTRSLGRGRVTLSKAA